MWPNSFVCVGATLKGRLLEWRLTCYNYITNQKYFTILGVSNPFIYFISKLRHMFIFYFYFHIRKILFYHRAGLLLLDFSHTHGQQTCPSESRRMWTFSLSWEYVWTFILRAVLLFTFRFSKSPPPPLPLKQPLLMYTFPQFLFRTLSGIRNIFFSTNVLCFSLSASPRALTASCAHVKLQLSDFCARLFDSISLIIKDWVPKKRFFQTKCKLDLGPHYWFRTASQGTQCTGWLSSTVECNLS